LNLFVYLHRDSRVNLFCRCVQTCRRALRLPESSLEQYPSADPQLPSPSDDQQVSNERANSRRPEPKPSGAVDGWFSQRESTAPVGSHSIRMHDEFAGDGNVHDERTASEESNDKCAGVREFWKLNYALNEDKPREGKSTVGPVQLSLRRERESSGFPPLRSKGGAEEGVEDVDESGSPRRELTRIDQGGLFNTFMLHLKKSTSLPIEECVDQADAKPEVHLKTISSGGSLDKSYHGKTQFQRRKSGDHFDGEDEIDQDNGLSSMSVKW
jgi:hypothetical protein